MLRAMGLATTVFVLWGPEPVGAGSDLAANAALKYWQAITTLPRFTAAEHDQLTAECLTMPLDAGARRMVAEAGYALDMVHRGAALPRCDWAIGWPDEGIGNRLPYLEGATLLSSLACLRARVRFEEGQNALGVADILAAMTLSRHTTWDGSLPSLVTCYANERRLSETLALNLARLDAQTIKDLTKRLGALPAGGSLATGVRQEQLLESGWFVRKVREAKDRDSLLAFLGRMCNNSRDEGRALLDACGGTAAGVIKRTEEVRAWYPVLAKHMDLPLDQFAKEQNQAARRLGANPMYKMWAPPIISCRWRQAEADIRRALLSAAVAVQEGGIHTLKTHPDPVLGGPFEYVPFAGGFELRSKWRPDEKSLAKWYLGRPEPLVLMVGRRGK
jgi:hypothetical protein